MESCLHHVPTNGNLLLIYCSHVGISAEGIIGKVERCGIKHPVNCCNSSIYAYDNCSLPKINNDQENYVIKSVNKHKNKFTNNEQKNMIILSNIIRHEIKNDIESLIGNIETPVVLLGGVNINTAEKDYFVVFQFGILQGGKFLNLKDILFDF